tara:strand:- start:272 stop:430 length:159 start_codon:yes stop_codon:yes gene_type:complete
MVLRFAVDPKFKNLKNKRKGGKNPTIRRCFKVLDFYGGMPDNKTKFPEENFP